MKKTFINKRSFLNIFILFSLISISAEAQSHKLAFSLTGGYVQGGFGGMATLDYKVNEFDYLQLNFQSNFTNLDYEDIEVPVRLYSFNAGFFFDVLRNNKRTFALAVGGGATAGSEIVNGGDDILENNEVLNTELIEPSKIVFGFYAGLDADIYLIPTIALTIKINETYHLNSDVGEFTPYMGLGVKLILK
ncbi:hypothetical protein GCM10022393_40220 [Aquimarina addita]|uniref:Conjugative transposon protein TraO n=1 Tax=Aquimarina addita TaxID=870485 RepID=A0ABP6UT77_9FLAO